MPSPTAPACVLWMGHPAMSFGAGTSPALNQSAPMSVPSPEIRLCWNLAQTPHWPTALELMAQRGDAEKHVLTTWGHGW